MSVGEGEIRTSRLILRSPAPTDAEALYEAYASDPEATRYLRWKPKQHPDEVREFLEAAPVPTERGREQHWVIELSDDLTPIGMFSVWYSDHGAELGFVLGRAHWRKGYLTEAGTAVMERLMSEPTIYRVWAYCDCENVASVRTLERLGLEREGVLRRWAVHPNIAAEPRDAFMYSRVR